jgi:uncharacterized Ntn-hydrolase superfamily protein
LTYSIVARDPATLLREGLEAGGALDRLLSADVGAAGRQLAIVDAAGGVAAHTGTSCMPDAGHVTADAVQPGWKVLLGRLPPDIAPTAQAVLERLADGT